jgi:hypothetical protein
MTVTVRQSAPEDIVRLSVQIDNIFMSPLIFLRIFGASAFTHWSARDALLRHDMMVEMKKIRKRGAGTMGARGPRSHESGRDGTSRPTPTDTPFMSVSMSALGHRLRNFLQRRSTGRYGHIQEVQGVPFYEARQPWWARFTWGFIAADLLVT